MGRRLISGRRGELPIPFPTTPTPNHPHSKRSSPPNRIISYVLLCGYSPFRSEDAKELVRETTEAKIEFHDRYWKNVSGQAKEFIRSLLNPDPAKRPTAEEAFSDPVRLYVVLCWVMLRY
jgi:serine/threonine protein kinase